MLENWISKVPGRRQIVIVGTTLIASSIAVSGCGTKTEISARPVLADTPKPASSLAAAKTFLQSLLEGKTDTAASLMSVKARSLVAPDYIPKMSGVLSACKKSTAELTTEGSGPDGALIIVDFIPPCSTLGKFSEANRLPTVNKLLIDAPLSVCNITVGSVDGIFRVVAPLACSGKVKLPWN